MDIEDKDIELKSEEIQEILSRPPHALIRWGITVFFMVISFLFIGGCFFSYPDTVEAGITITTENPPAWIVARSTGKLKEVFLKDKQKVKAGELIGVVNNPADTREVLLLKKELEAFQINDSMICQGHFTGRLTLGEIQSAYTGFIKSLTEYRDFLKLDLYKEKEEAARRELNEYQIYISHLHNEVNLNKEELKLALSSYSREEILYKKGLVSASDYEKEQQAYLASKRGTEQMQTTLSSARIQEAISQFYAYLSFYCDSMFNDPTGRRLWGQMMVQAIRSRNYASMPTSKITSNYYYKNYPEGKITTLALLGTTECLMEEEYISQDWKLADSTKIIHGYQCRLAECHFRGRNYHAWFAPEIPLNEGPWKFNGLPGLILEVYDTQDHYHFTLIGMQQEGTEPVCYYNFRPNYEKIDRIKYLKMSASRTHKGVDPEIKKVLNLDKMTPKTKNAQGQTIACDFMEKDYR